MKAAVMGLDLGTTLCKCAAYDAAGRQLALASRWVDTDRTIPNGAQQQATDWIRAITGALSEAAQQMDAAVEVVAIGVSAHGPGVVLTDKDAAPLCPFAISVSYTHLDVYKRQTQNRNIPDLPAGRFAKSVPQIKHFIATAEISIVKQKRAGQKSGTDKRCRI